MTDMDHYDAIVQRQNIHRSMLESALAMRPSKKRDAQIEWSKSQIERIEKERIAEASRCGMSAIEGMSDDEILDALGLTR